MYMSVCIEISFPALEVVDGGMIRGLIRDMLRGYDSRYDSREETKSMLALARVLLCFNDSVTHGFFGVLVTAGHDTAGSRG